MLILPKAVLFDMDGTITRPVLDFPKLKAEMGIGDRPILEALAKMSDPERRAAEAILHRHEKLAADDSAVVLPRRSLKGTEGISTWISMRSSRGPLILPR